MHRKKKKTKLGPLHVEMDPSQLLLCTLAKIRRQPLAGSPATQWVQSGIVGESKRSHRAKAWICTNESYGAEGSTGHQQTLGHHTLSIGRNHEEQSQAQLATATPPCTWFTFQCSSSQEETALALPPVLWTWAFFLTLAMPIPFYISFRSILLHYYISLKNFMFSALILPCCSNSV